MYVMKGVQQLAMSGQAEAEELISLQKAIATTIADSLDVPEDRPSAVPDLLFFRRHAPTDPAFCLIAPSIVLVVQGVKRMLIGADAYDYDPGSFLITSLDLPASTQVVQASPDTPCLGLVLKLDLHIIAELIASGVVPHPEHKSGRRGIGLGTMSLRLLRAIRQLCELHNESCAIEVLRPGLLREIHYRLLLSDQASALWQIVSAGSQSQRVAKAIDWLKLHYAEALRIDDLAARVQMSSSSLHHHFRQLTSMSPLQYQKWLRLNEAKRLMLNENTDAATAAFRVGYESPSQFSREYRRLFGAPPRQDISLHRQESGVPETGIRLG
jgi:AraC-like DNA-binding protein